jgi:hypothetical protein
MTVYVDGRIVPCDSVLVVYASTPMKGEPHSVHAECDTSGLKVRVLSTVDGEEVVMDEFNVTTAPEERGGVADNVEWDVATQEEAMDLMSEMLLDALDGGTPPTQVMMFLLEQIGKIGVACGISPTKLMSLARDAMRDALVEEAQNYLAAEA